MATASASETRARLKRLGERRAKLQAEEKRLAKDTQEALDDSYGVVSVAEASRLLRIHRTTVYRVYEPHGRAAA